MKKPFLFSLIVSILFSCHQTEEKKSTPVTSIPKKDAIVAEKKLYLPGSTITADSVYQMEIEGKNFFLRAQVIELRDSLNDYSYVTNIKIVEETTEKILFENTYDYNTIGQFQNPAPGHYWIDLYESGGGSGFAGTIFNIRLKPTPDLQKITGFGELSWWKSNKNATRLLYLGGYWDMDQGESHFEAHKQGVGMYSIQDDTVIYIDLGNTKYKYDFYNTEEMSFKNFNEFRQKEKAIVSKINWEEFE